MRCLGHLLVLILIFVSPPTSAVGQETGAADSQQKSAPPPASINDVAWIAGHWQGSAMGGKFEETWNPPFAGSMVGMFKFVETERVQFYELLTIVEKEGSLLLRLKHFDKELNGWEEKDKSVEFPLKSVNDTKASFDGLVFQKIDESTMHILVAVEQNDGEAKEIKFVCHRVKQGG